MTRPSPAEPDPLGVECPRCGAARGMDCTETEGNGDVIIQEVAVQPHHERVALSMVSGGGAL